MADSNQWYTHDFPRAFQASRSGLEGRVANAQANPDVINELSQELAKLSKSLADVNAKLPTYDQRQYGLQIKALEASIEELRAATKPKTKFTFRRTAVAAVTQQQPAIPSLDEATPPSHLPTLSNDTQHTLISSQSYRYVSLLDIMRLNHLPSELTISNLDHCIVNLTSNTTITDNAVQLSTVHVENIKNSVLIFPIIKGSILLHDLTCCAIVVGCHQFRMHDSRQINVHLSITTNPIIENCSEIGFGAYPDDLGRLYLNKKEDSKHLDVQDFSHIRSSPSPHWFALDNDSIVKSWPRREIHDREQIEELLSALLPCRK